MAILQLVYTSRATEPVTRLAATNILAAARRRNAANGITGALMHTERHFAQLLEGEYHAVNETFRRIKRDPRHHQVHLLHYATADERACSDWSMHYSNKDDGLDGVLLCCLPLVQHPDRAAEALAHTLIEVLAKNGSRLRLDAPLDLQRSSRAG